MVHYLIFTAATASLLAGLLLAIRPAMRPRIERALNLPVGEREVLNLRAGMPGERRVEEILNRPVLQKIITWDHWVGRYPRTVGAALLLMAAALFAIAATR